MSELKCNIAAISAWGKQFSNWDELAVLLQANPNEPSDEEANTAPKPEIIPANERRRAPLPVKLAVESSWQACQASVYEPKDLACVFVSGLGDTQLTDYMCKVLAGDNKQLSPTKFHNSVHNAAAGYWTISTGCMQAANSVAGYQESVTLTLLEAITQCVAEQQPILLTFYDAPVSPILKPLLKNEHAFAASMIIEPASEAAKNSLAISVENTPRDWPNINCPPTLQACYQQNPVARILALLSPLAQQQTQQETQAQQQSSELLLPLSAGSSLKININ